MSNSKFSLKSLDWKRFFTDILFDIVGGLLYGAGVYTFAAKANFVPGGVSGLAIIGNRLLPAVSIGTWIVLINIPIVLFCLKTLGKGFLIRSLRTILITSAILDWVFPRLPAYTGEPLMAALFAGALAGAGLALIYWRGSSTGGTDFLILSLRKMHPHMQLGMLSAMIDGSVILLSGLIFGRIDAVLQGVVMTVACSIVINKITVGFVNGQLTLIVTDKGDEVAKIIMDEVERGVTAMDATGMYSGSDKTVLMCACSRAEAVRVRALAQRIDTQALVLLCPYDTAYGFGFQPPEA